MILQAVWKRQGKRLRRGLYMAEKFALYGQIFRYRFKELVNDAFIKEAGLDNAATFDVVCESLRTDYGLHIIVVEGAPKKKAKAKGKSKDKSKEEDEE